MIAGSAGGLDAALRWNVVETDAIRFGPWLGYTLYAVGSDGARANGPAAGLAVEGGGKVVRFDLSVTAIAWNPGSIKSDIVREWWLPAEATEHTLRPSHPRELTMNLPDPILRITDAIRTANAGTGFTYFTPVADDPEVWTLCSRGVGPVFVPLVARRSSPLGLHIQPGVPLADQHLATFDHESHGLCMMGRGLDRLLICLYLANKYTFHNWGESSQFLAWLEAVRAAAPTLLLGVPSELHTPALAAMTGSSWEPWGGEGADPYRHAQNPLVGLAGCPDMFDETEALAQLEALADVDGADAHICALRAVLAAGNGRTLTAAQYMTWLPRESWYFLADFGCVGYYLPSAAAPAWHGVLRYGFPEVLRGTPFAPLERCPNAFNDKAGVPILIEIADTYRDLGDRERELGTLRNAATVSLVTTHRYPAGLLERIASVCDS